MDKRTVGCDRQYYLDTIIRNIYAHSFCLGFGGCWIELTLPVAGCRVVGSWQGCPLRLQAPFRVSGHSPPNLQQLINLDTDGDDKKRLAAKAPGLHIYTLAMVSFGTRHGRNEPRPSTGLMELALKKEFKALNSEEEAHGCANEAFSGENRSSSIDERGCALTKNLCWIAHSRSPSSLSPNPHFFSMFRSSST